MLREYERILRERVAGAVRKKKREVYVLVGRPGTGKTRLVYERHAEEEVFRLPINQGTAVWWDGLCAHKVALIDEYSSEKCITWDSFKEILDPWYNNRVPVKGTHALCCCDVIYITSNKEPWEWYPQKSDEEWEEVRRRVTKFYWVGPGQPTNRKIVLQRTSNGPAQIISEMNFVYEFINQ